MTAESFGTNVIGPGPDDQGPEAFLRRPRAAHRQDVGATTLFTPAQKRTRVRHRRQARHAIGHRQIAALVAAAAIVPFVFGVYQLGMWLLRIG